MVVGQSSLQLMHKSFLEGALTFPQDARRNNNVPRRLPGQIDHVYRLFYWCWSDVAQNLPDARPSSNSGNECGAVSGPRSPSPPGWSLDGALMVSGPRKTMPRMARQERHDMYRTRCPPGSTPANRRTFDRTYRLFNNKPGTSKQNPSRQMRYLAKN